MSNSPQGTKVSAEDETWRLSHCILKCTRKRLIISAPKMAVARKLELHWETVITIVLLCSSKNKTKKRFDLEEQKGFKISPASHFLSLGMQKFPLIPHVPDSFDTALIIALFPPPRVQLLLQIPLLSQCTLPPPLPVRQLW